MLKFDVGKPFTLVALAVIVCFSSSSIMGQSAPVPPPVDVVVDVNPDTLNLRSNGRYITAYIEFPPAYDPAAVDVSTVVLSVDGTSEFVEAEPRPTDVNDYDTDGVDELMVKFRRRAVKALLSPGETVTIYIGGELPDGSDFLGTDAIRVLGESANKKVFNVLRQATGGNKKACLAGTKIFEALTSDTVGPKRLRGATRSALRLLQRLVRKAPSPELADAVTAVRDAVDDLGVYGQALPPRIDPLDTALTGQAQVLADALAALAESYAAEKKAWAGARRSLGTSLDMSAVQAALDTENVQLGELLTALDDFRALTTDPELLELADKVEALATALLGYIDAVEAFAASW